MSLTAAYLVAGEQRDNYDYTPEASRRARGFALYAALRSLGRRGVAELIERNCAQAALFARLLRDGGAEILNDVVLNQVLVAAPPSAVARMQADGTCWVGRHGLARPPGDAASRSPTGRRPTPTSSARRAAILVALSGS